MAGCLEPESRRLMLKIADSYEALAERAQQRRQRDPE
jgi:hypothetical protein